MPELFASPDVSVVADGPDGSVVLTARAELGDYPVSVVHALRHWADVDPGHPLIARRVEGEWETRSYGEVVSAANAAGQALLDRGLGPERPLLILSGNSLEHFVVGFAALTAGVPVVPVSVAYSLQSKDHARVKEIALLTEPGAVFADDAAKFAPALRALGDIPAIVSVPSSEVDGEELGTLLRTEPGKELDRAFRALTPDSIAKILFTSGSTGAPKGVLNTHRMLSSNQQSIRRAWPFLGRSRPVLVDWLPWSHTFGGNHNVNLVVTNGGTLYVDDGRPSPDLIGTTISNLAEVRPTVYFNVPAGWAQLVPALENDREFAARFFSRLDLMFNAAAALPATLRTRLETLAAEVTGRRIPVTGSWGATETAPAVTSAHYDFADARCLGVPLPGAEVKLVPDQDAYEIRVRGPMVTPGYLGRQDLTDAAFDEDGFYRTGDAVAFADPEDINAGLVFRGRIAEDFKLSTGTFVRVGAVRTTLLSAARVLADVVVVGEDRAQVCALAWLNQAETVTLLGEEPADTGDLVAHTALAAHLAGVLAELNRSAGSASRIERLLVLARKPDLDAGEITDKGYVNQRRVLANRAHLVELLYADPLPPEVVTAS
jgi:feruloyl-CoA synthase